MRDTERDKLWIYLAKHPISFKLVAYNLQNGNFSVKCLSLLFKQISRVLSYTCMCLCALNLTLICYLQWGMCANELQKIVQQNKLKN